MQTVLGLGKGSLPSNICDERIAQQVILHAAARKLNGLGVHVNSPSQSSKCRERNTIADERKKKVKIR